MLARPNAPEKRPWYLPRSAGGNMSPMIAKALPIIMPEPKPWIARQTMSCSIDCEVAAPMDVSMRTVMPVRKNGLRPNMSESLPARGIVVVLVSMKAVNTQLKRLSPPRSPMIAGSAVVTVVWFIAATKSAVSVPTRMIRFSKGETSMGVKPTLAGAPSKFRAMRSILS